MAISRVVCPDCGSRNLEALLRSSVVLDRYATHGVIGIRGGKLVLGKRAKKRWEDNDHVEDTQLDEELKCLDCGGFPVIDALNLGVDDFRVGRSIDTDTTQC